MLERYFYYILKKEKIILAFVLSLFLVLIIGLFTHYFANNIFILIILVVLFLAYPTHRYLKELSEIELNRTLWSKNVLFTYEKEITMFLGIFFGSIIGFMILFSTSFIPDFPVFYSEDSSFKPFTQESFTPILLNNLLVGLLTFTLSFLIFSGFLFVLIWNAALISYTLLSLISFRDIVSHFFLILAHTIFEFTGYILLGFAGTLLAYGFNHFNIVKKKIFYFEHVGVLVLLGFLIIVLGAVIETL